jgi:hypothetical protein
VYVLPNKLITRELKSQALCLTTYLVWLHVDESVDSLKKKTQERDRSERGTQTTMATAENNTRKRQE